MNCLIVEDEPYAAEHLENQLQGLNVNILSKADTVERAVEWLMENPVDLIFMDIQLGDGLSFEIFDHIRINTPVIFTTSYDQYLMKAFEVNSIAYILKPVKKEDLYNAINKYKRMYAAEPLNNRLSTMRVQQQVQKRFLVKSGNSLLSVKAEDISYFHLQHKRYLFIVTKDNKQYIYDSTMETIEQRLDQEQFFRINRQFIVNYHAIKSLQPSERGRVKIEMDPESKEEMIVSINKAAEFKSWLDR